jgi:hypothetical protein
MKFTIFGLVVLALTVGLLKADDTSVLPVKVTFRESLLIKGTFVAQFRNEGDKNLLLHVEFDRANNSNRKTFTLLVPANHFKEVGNNQGWVVVSGDQIKIASEGYPEMDAHMP